MEGVSDMMKSVYIYFRKVICEKRYIARIQSVIHNSEAYKKVLAIQLKDVRHIDDD